VESIVIQKSPIEQLRIERREYKGHAFIDVRTYYQNDDGEWCPTRKGVTIALDLLAEFKAAIAGLAVDEPPARRRGSRSRRT
jgi:Transcriptional Coactivator p15 (PC4)